jgi:hypothetical protein
MTYIAGPVGDFHAFRADIEANVLDALDQAGDLGARVRAGSRADRFYGTVETGNYFRVPYGPGWALVGDFGNTGDAAQRRSLVPRVARLGTGVVAVLGNHDSHALMLALAKRGVTVLTSHGRLLADGH